LLPTTTPRALHLLAASYPKAQAYPEAFSMWLVVKQATYMGPIVFNVCFASVEHVVFFVIFNILNI
jgi:hypothetical protein